MLLKRFLVGLSIIGAGLLYASTNSTSSNFFNKNKEGWFWYEKTHKSEDENRTDEDEKFMNSIPLDKLDSLTAEQFRKTFEKAKDIAVMKPTLDNVQVVRRMQKFMGDQSMKYTEVFKFANIIDDKNNYDNIGTGGFSNDNLKTMRDLRKKAKYLTDDIVFVTFFKDDQSPIAQKQLVKHLEGFHATGIEPRFFVYTTLEDQDTVKKLGLSEDVENFVFKKSTGEWIRIRKSIIDPDDFIKDFIFYEETKDKITRNKNKMKIGDYDLGDKKENSNSPQKQTESKTEHSWFNQ